MEGVDGDVVVYMKSRPREAASERRKRGQEGSVEMSERNRHGGNGKEERRNRLDSKSGRRRSGGEGGCMVIGEQ